MNLTFLCPTFDASGYAEAARSIIFGLLEHGNNIRIIPKDWSQLDAGLPSDQKRKLVDLCGSVILPEGPIVQICAAQFFQPFPDRVNIGVTMLECDRIPQHWARKCNQMDQIWVPSTFNQETFAKSGVNQEKIRVCHLGVEDTRFHPGVAPMSLPEVNDRFLFLSNFEWVPRKGYDLLLQAYLEEFTSQDPVALVIKTYDGSSFDPNGTIMRKTWQRMIEREGVNNPPVLKFLTGGMKYEEIPSFYTAGNCYIIPTRGEGWNLPALEAMSSGIPVITTNWSAHLDFVNDENSYLIAVERMENIPEFGISNDDIYRGSNWAVPLFADIRKWMRHVYEHPQECKQKGMLARENVIRKWSTAKMTTRILYLLHALEGLS
ncbi:glycosyltransferase family 4 protein [Brevibacillus borstelensis]|uniref:glycosyltransferase family 4 protein n=1 Tax=Brevibacillus borstelensis TaxID=45462 RepID=UPI0030BF7563